MHDALLSAVLPDVGADESWNKIVWSKLVFAQMKVPHSFDNPDIVAMLRKAPEIEGIVSKIGQSLEKLRAVNLKRIADGVKYSNTFYDYSLSELCVKWGISESGFERGRIARKNVPEKDFIPEIKRINGEEIGNLGYYLQKLSKEDPRILLVGQYVGCCNHLDGQTKTMAVAHVTSPYGGCYALFKRSNGEHEDEIVDKSSIWISEADESGKYDLCFNSWERRISMHASLAAIGLSFFKAAAEKVLRMDPNINRVILGRNRDNFPLVPIASKECAVPVDPDTASYDSQKQFVLMTRNAVPVPTSSPNRPSPRIQHRRESRELQLS